MSNCIVVLRINRSHLQMFEAAELLTHISNEHRYAAPPNFSVTKQGRNMRKRSCTPCRKKKRRCIHDAGMIRKEDRKKRNKQDNSNAEKVSKSRKTHEQDLPQTTAQTVSNGGYQEAEDQEESVLYGSETLKDNETISKHSGCRDCTIGDGCFGTDDTCQLSKELLAKVFRKPEEFNPLNPMHCKIMRIHTRLGKPYSAALKNELVLGWRNLSLYEFLEALGVFYLDDQEVTALSMATKDPIFQPHSVIVVFELLEKEVIRFQHLMDDAYQAVQYMLVSGISGPALEEAAAIEQQFFMAYCHEESRKLIAGAWCEESGQTINWGYRRAVQEVVQHGVAHGFW